MATPVSRLRAVYGSGVLHLLTMQAGLALAGYLVVTAGPSTLWTPEGARWKSIALWFAAAIIFHDLVLFPVYALADRLLDTAIRGRRETAAAARNYLRVPALGSGLILLIFLPDIIRQGATKYFEDTGLSQEPFLSRWLMLTAVLFAASAVVFVIRAGSARR